MCDWWPLSQSSLHKTSDTTSKNPENMYEIGQQNSMIRSDVKDTTYHTFMCEAVYHLQISQYPSVFPT